MTGTGQRLERALAAWGSDSSAALPSALVDASPAETIRSRLAVEVLAASEAFFAATTHAAGGAERELILAFLESTSRPAFLGALGDAACRHRWAEASFAAIRRSGFTLETMLAERARTLGARPLFEEYGRTSPARWSYARVQARARSFAAAFLAAGGSDPRVALFLDNSVDGACSDLACLLHDILVAPLSIHFATEELVWIFDRLRITVAVSDTEERLHQLLEVQHRVRAPFAILALQPDRVVDRGDAELLAAAAARLDPAEVDARLAARPRRALDDPCTVMFTSGSTGRPKGVVFTQFNLVSKRFARAAALPDVGHDETLLCYLPLFHTFGRYLEMLGMVFWRGTYVFAGNPSAETLLAGLKQVRPTGLIGIPLRWVQIRDRTLEALAGARSAHEREAAFRSVVGGRLRWGLSAAGFLEPKVFQHFHRYGVELCSGFGMTEATGGITMSPPGDYLPKSVGTPLPGVRVRLAETGEMLIGGPYVARYLAEEGTGTECEPALQAGGDEWIATGDVFQTLERGHLTLVDRVKDIYKNDRGQTIPPHRVERKFHGVPGIKRVFLVGDHRSYNVLLIVPEPADPVLQQAPDDESRREYFHQILAAANEDLAPYERVVNFALLERDFDAERGELTAKGSYRRKAIEENFAGVIQTLYERPWVEYVLDGRCVHVPRWFFRDVGVLETDVRAVEGGLHDRRRGVQLPLHREPGETSIRVGDLDYEIDGDVVDLGTFARQPRLWMANPALIRFAPCKAGWDVGLGGVSAIALLPRGGGDRASAAGAAAIQPRGIGHTALLDVNRLLQTALYGDIPDALAALDRLAKDILFHDDRLGAVIRRRITALARHDDEAVRCLAYRILLLDEAVPEYGDAFPAFIHSGLSFLNEESIEAIAVARFEPRRLQALRQRLFKYRTQLAWPAGEVARQQFAHVLDLLVSFVHQRPEYYKPVRAELASWILHRDDPHLAARAQDLLDDLARWFEARLEATVHRLTPEEVRWRLQFDDEIPETDRSRISHLLSDTSFLRQSVILAFDEQNFDLDQVGDSGIWVSRLLTRGHLHLYRIGVNTVGHRHFDLLVILRDDMDADAVKQTNYWVLSIGEHPHGDRTLPRFGCMRPELAAMSLEYVQELTVADRIRELAGAEQPKVPPSGRNDWRKLYIRALATVFLAWNNSGRRIVPGSIDPANVVVPERDWHEGAVLLSLAGWEPYRDTLSLVRPMVRTFYRKTAVLYPGSATMLQFEWIFDACVEALGAEAGLLVLRQLRVEAAETDADAVDRALLESLDAYLREFAAGYHRPLALSNAIGRYEEWCRVNAQATPEARAQLLEQLIELYHLDRFGEMARYHLYRSTYFAGAPEDVRATYDRLLAALDADPERSATECVELSDLQDALASPSDRVLFSRLVFPRARGAQRLEVVTFGDSEHKQVTVCTHFADARGESYDMREPVEPEEIGQLYRLFFQERFPKTVSELDRHLVTIDTAGRVVGGLCYRLESSEVAHMDGVVVNAAVGGRGVATALLEDFATRMASRGVKVLRTGFFMRRFCEQRGFHLDRRWGGLVRFLTTEAADADGTAPR